MAHNTSNIFTIIGLILIVIVSFSILGYFSLFFMSESLCSNRYDDFDSIQFSAIDNQDNIILYGTTMSLDFPFTINLTKTYSKDPVIFLMKYAPSGELIWSIKYQKSSTDIPSSIVIDENNNIFISGTNYNYESLEYDLFISKFSSSGELMFEHTINNIGYFDKTTVLVSQDNNIYLFGTMKEQFEFTDRYNSIIYGEHLFLTKINQSGEILWTQSFKPYTVESVTFDNENNLIFTSYETELNPDQTPHYNLYLSKIGSNGTLLWSYYINEVGIGHQSKISIDSENSILLTGLTRSANYTLINNTKLTSISENGEIYVTKLTTDGNKEWDKILLLKREYRKDVPFISLIGNNTIDVKGAFFNYHLENGPTMYSLEIHNNGTLLNNITEMTHSPRTLKIKSIQTDQMESYYVLGRASEPSNVLSGTLKGTNDILLFKFNSDHNLLWGTYIGGAGEQVRSCTY